MCHLGIVPIETGDVWHIPKCDLWTTCYGLSLTDGMGERKHRQVKDIKKKKISNRVPPEVTHTRRTPSGKAVGCLLAWLLASCPNNMLVYLRDGSV